MQLEPGHTQSAAEALQERDGHFLVEAVSADEYVAVHRLMYHWTMLRGMFMDTTGYDDRWCYATLEKALVGLEDWRGRGWVTEPTGWHRHPRTGRRRTNGDPATEYIAY